MINSRYCSAPKRLQLVRQSQNVDIHANRPRVLANLLNSTRLDSSNNAFRLRTGVSRGIGTGIAKSLLSRGCNLVGISRTATAEIEELKKIGGERFVDVRGDVASLEDVQKGNSPSNELDSIYQSRQLTNYPRYLYQPSYRRSRALAPSTRSSSTPACSPRSPPSAPRPTPKQSKAI